MLMDEWLPNNGINDEPPPRGLPSAPSERVDGNRDANGNNGRESVDASMGGSSPLEECAAHYAYNPYAAAPMMPYAASREFFPELGPMPPLQPGTEPAFRFSPSFDYQQHSFTQTTSSPPHGIPPAVAKNPSPEDDSNDPSFPPTDRESKTVEALASSHATSTTRSKNNGDDDATSDAPVAQAAYAITGSPHPSLASRGSPGRVDYTNYPALPHQAYASAPVSFGSPDGSHPYDYYLSHPPEVHPIGEALQPTMALKAAPTQGTKGSASTPRRQTPQRRAKKAVKAAKAAKSSPATKGKRMTRKQVKPSDEDWRNARTNRARKALETWYKRLDQLGEYVQEHGDCRVPQKYPKNPSLGIWVNKQRMEYKNWNSGQNTSLTSSKIEALEELGFIWAKPKGDLSWEERFGELVQFKKDHGNCNPPTKGGENPALGRWVSTQRAQYKKFQKGEPTNMTYERVEKLEKVGFCWNMLAYP